MKANNKWLTSMLCLMMVVLFAVGLTACGGECEHQWSAWSTTKTATCLEAGAQERQCEECGEKETSPTEALGHSWQNATCTMPKTCKNCAATDGQPLAHTYTQEVAKAETLKAEATCSSAAVYYKSCVCGAISQSDADTFLHGAPAAHGFTVETVKEDALKSEVTCTDAAVYYKSCVCGAISQSDADTFQYGALAAHCFTEESAKATALKLKATCTDAAVYYKSCVCGAVSTNDADIFSYGAPTAHHFTVELVRADALKLKATCTNAAVYYKSCICGATSSSDADTFTIGASLAHAFTLQLEKPEALKSPATTTSAAVYYKSCVCGAISTNEEDTFTIGGPIGHIHSYTVQSVKPEAQKTAATCNDAAVYYLSCACGSVSTNDADTFTSGTARDHKDDNKDHLCDHGCGKADMGAHTDSDSDADHVCDYGCGVKMNECGDAGGDGNHDCDVCGNTDVTGHDYGEATCGVPSTCSECGATTGETLSHTDVSKDHICDNGCGKMDVGAHADSPEDEDHLCDYGCKAVLEACSDVETDNDHNCDVCGKENVTTHRYEETAATAATCEAAATKSYACNCGDAYTDTLGAALDHDIADVKAVEQKVSGCEYVLVYTCKRENCGADVAGEKVYHHSHVASITSAATCKADGVKTLTCACGDTFTEKIEKNTTGHDWQNGEIQNGVRTDRCALCEETKTVTVYEGTNTGNVNAADLKDKEIELNGANISLDNSVIDTLGDQNVTVSADKFEGDLGLTEEQRDQVGNSPIYDFKINGENGSVSDFGDNSWVTITLPYTLDEGEDVDSIAVWFISNRCENKECTDEACVDPAHKLVSIKATYNNGYVTFKTNHFSYYTVTNLTPAERCALYGHGYAEQQVEGSCTTDAYTLYVCVRCHDKYMDHVVPAPGHQYEETIVPASCTLDGSATYTCACGHTYSTKLNATGHAFEVAETVAATCVTDGYTKYGCANCDEEYTVTAAKLAHVYTDTVVAATCTADGYTLHDCDNCDYSYTDAYVKAKGHAYVTDGWAWTADHRAATLNLVCQNDASHKTAVNATIASEAVTHVCTGYSKTTYTATASFNKVVYTDVKEVEVGSPEHSYSAQWSKDNNIHWRECLCGEKIDAGKHAFENAETTKAPTCAEAGESTATCVCGDTKVTTIPATGEHSYVNGACSTCGKRETDCDHTELTEQVIDLGILGACEGKLYYYSCACGQVKLIDQDQEDLSWEPEILESNQYEDENGNLCYTMHAACKLCGLEVLYRATEMSNGCTVTTEVWYTFLVNDVVVLDNGYIEDTYTYHADSVEVEIDMEQYGACGGYLEAYQCAECGEIINVFDMALDCDIDDHDITEEEIVDENGKKHLVMRASCPDCGLSVVMDAKEMESNACVQHWIVTTTITVGEQSFVGTYDTSQGQHDETYSYELVGEHCEDEQAIKVTSTCAVCGETRTWWTSGHQYEMKVLNLKDLGKCESDIRYHACTICGQVDMVEWADVSCDVEDDVASEYTDEDGNVHTVRTGICPDCGLTLVVDRWYVVESVCETVPHMVISIYDGETLIFHGPISIPYSSNHQWQIHYEILGESCEDGYRVTMCCEVCGKTSTYNSWGHEYQTHEIDLNDYGFCGGFVVEEYCAICKTVFDIRTEYVCPFQYQGENEEGYIIWRCEFCGGTILQLQQRGEKDEHCQIELTVKNIFLMNGEEVYRCEYYRFEDQHNYSCEFEMYGESCLDGYKAWRTCQDCGMTLETEHNTHIIFQQFALGEKDGCCAAHAVQYGDCPCGYGGIFNFDEKTLVYHEETRSYECDQCHLAIVNNNRWTEDGCYRVETVLRTIVLGGDEIYRNERESRYDSHDFVATKVSMVNGTIYISAKCTNCDLTTSAQIQQGMLEEHDDGYYYEYTFRPDATGTYTIVGLSDDDTYVTLYRMVGEKMEQLASDASGNGRNFCLTAELTAEETYVYRLRSYGKSNVVYFSLNHGMEGVCRHSWVGRGQFAVLPEGADSCEDGIISGWIYGCGCIGDMGVEYRHITTIQESIDLTQYGACSGSYVISASCPCGQKTSTYEQNTCFHRTHDSWHEDKDGKGTSVNTRSCDKCGVQLKTVYYREAIAGTCTATEYRTISVIDKDGNEAFSRDLVQIVTQHNTRLVSASLMEGAKTCEDGVNLIYQCVHCDYSHNNRSYGHTTMAKEYIDLTQFGACSGRYVISASCPCGQETSGNYYDNDCLDSRSHDGYKDDEGRWIEVMIRSCDKCGIQLKKATYTEAIPGTCMVTEYTTMTVIDKNGDEIYGRYFEATREAHDTQIISATLVDGATTCEDGVDLIWKCRNCEYTTTGRTYGHAVVEENNIDLTKHGACSGEFILLSCACGQKTRCEMDNLCGKWTYNRYQDQEGKWIEVDTCACETCGLRYTQSSYAVPMEDSCMETCYYTITITVGKQLIADLSYSVLREAHDYEITGTLLEGATTCKDGVRIAERCKKCGEQYSYTEYGHVSLPQQIIELSQYGSTCGGKAVLYACVCGQYRHMSLDTNCDLNQTSCELWIEDVVVTEKSQPSIDGWHSYGYGAWIRTCSVTNPESCNCKIRYAQYWLKDGDSCSVSQYETWQFGYNEETGECLYEVTFKYGNKEGTYHNYTETTETNTRKFDCADCGSYYYEYEYYDENGNWLKTEKQEYNALNNGKPQYSQRVDQPYVGPFGDGGSHYIITRTYADGTVRTEEYAQVWVEYIYRTAYYTIYSAWTEGDVWERYDYSYRFENGCVSTAIFTDSNGAERKTQSNVCVNHRVTLKTPTCSQAGEEAMSCLACGQISENQVVDPLDHAWVKISQEHYYCFICGLENSKGASGDIILEDLTATYGNNTHYVVGYAVRNDVSFTQYVSVILANGEEIIANKIQVTKLEKISAFAFSKEEVADWAAANGYTDYAVRFTFVPVGADGSFDYGITFAEASENVKLGVITGNVSFTTYIPNEIVNSFTITPTEDGIWTFTSAGDMDPLAELYDQEGRRLAGDDDGGEERNFKIVYELKAGQTYTLKVEHWNWGPCRTNLVITWEPIQQ